ncbi:MAG: UdgX family uracil-DNA binding protein [Chloroflexi bacterium]|nr:MAG: UdgX family uracil-DNA binding protein [Chloroflexota bacterium]TME90658.1 MAG: UdgX family uracil-DNA binding protein [Chloroflexota bacterium]
MGAEEFIPDQLTLESLREAASGCRGCDLWEDATQTVFGDGGKHANVMLIGEQPGDREDIEGKPFVGPAGRILDEGLEAAQIARTSVYVTNAVKHFRFTRRGKRRLHEKPNSQQVRACRPWLQAEVETVRPSLLVLLGATAAQSLLGPTFRVTQHRGKVIPTPLGIPAVATVHPSSILRAPDGAAREEAMAAFIADLRSVKRQLG